MDAPAATSAATVSTRRAVTALGLGALGAYLASAPRLVNGDGLGYLKEATVAGPPPPGHVLYLVLLRAVARLAGRSTALGLLGPARVVSAVCGALAAALFVPLALEAGLSRRAAILGALGLAVSWGLWQEADDVEAYAPALCALVLALLLALRAGRRRGVLDGTLAGLAAALAVLLHLALVLALPALALLALRDPEGRRPRLAHAMAAAGTAGVVTLGPLAAIAFGTPHRHGLGVGGALAWLLRSDHGFHYPLHLYTPAIALWGLSRTFAFAAYPVDAPLAVVVAESAVALAALAAVALLVRSSARPPRLPRAAILLWALPTAALGVFYYGSDTERWIFLLPLVWLLAGAARPRRVTLLVAALACWNLAAEVVPDALRSSVRARAATDSAVLASGDLVVCPGHAWDEYLGFYQARAVRVIPLAYFAGARGSAEGALAVMDGEIDRALARGAHVYAARVFLPAAADRTDGWKEMRSFGLDRAVLRRHLEARYLLPSHPAGDLVPIRAARRAGY